MPKLHLVGITPDHRGLVLSEHARAKRGDMVLEIDHRLLEAIDKAQRLRILDEGHRLESAALPSRREIVNGDSAKPGRLTPREIQQRLRAGESITAMARSSGTDEAWIRRFAAPVLAEQARIVERARAVIFTKRGVGPSAAPLGAAVAANVIDRGVPLTLPELEAGWGAYQHPEGGWHVTFSFPLRGRRQTAEWEFDVAAGELTARNKLASELGWRESGRKLPQPKPAKAPAPRRATGGSRSAPTAPPSDASDPPADAADEPAKAADPPADAADKPAKAADPPADAADKPAKAADPPADAADQPDEDAVQALPLNEEPTLPPGGLVHKVPPARKAPAKKASAGKRAAAAVTETPAKSVVPVPDAQAETPAPADADAAAPNEAGLPAGSMPPTDLDVVDVVVDIRSLDDETVPQRAPLGAPPAPPGGPPAK